MKVMVEMEAGEVAQKFLNENGMMAVDRELMERLQKMHPDLMRYRSNDDSYQVFQKNLVNV